MTSKAQKIISTALERAMASAPHYLLRGMQTEGNLHTFAMEIARRMVRELDHAGYNPKPLSAASLRDLEDQICEGLSMANFIRLASESPEWSKQARGHATRYICTRLHERKMVLLRRTDRRDDY